MHFDKQGVIEYLNTLVPLDMFVDLILLRCPFSEVFVECISNGYCMRLMKFLLYYIIWSLEDNVILAYVQFALVVDFNLAYMGS